MPSTANNLEQWLSVDLPEWARQSIKELVRMEAWDELNDRFFKDITFGTGGMRGRVLGKVQTKSETGMSESGHYPKFPAVGTNTINDFNVIRATIGLYRYSRNRLLGDRLYEIPRLVIAHDVRYFSRHFCELTASTWTRLGGQALIFDGPRSTPQLSFSIRNFEALAGVVITASHNPPHDNGFKVYLNDGGQIVPPHDKGIIAEVNKVLIGEIISFLEKRMDNVVCLSKHADNCYLKSARESIINENAVEKMKSKIVFTAIHGTGGIATLPLLNHYGVRVVAIREQSEFSPDFPTVKSPNPEERDALRLGIEKAREVGAIAVFGTDPDSDRVGLAVSDRNGDFRFLSGNNVLVALAEYRIRALKSMRILPEKGTNRAALIKSSVTTPMLDIIAKNHGLKLINTLTGFKWIGNKLLEYETVLKNSLMESSGIAVDYDNTERNTRIKLLLENSTYMVLGGEESCGYLGHDILRDKDANAAVLMLCELIGHLESRGQTILDFLDEIYSLYGFYSERLVCLTYEGSSGCKIIRKIIDNFRKHPPKVIGGMEVLGIIDYGEEMITDEDGKVLPQEDVFRVMLKNDYLVYLRPSGTEPKIKIYVYGYHHPVDISELEAYRNIAGERTERIADAIKNGIEKFIY